MTLHRDYLGVSVDERVSSRRSRLVDAGIELFGTRGFRATSVDEVCNLAGLSKRYFYESFSDREALMLAVYETLDAGHRESVLSVLAVHEAESIHDLARITLRASLEHLAQDSRRGKVMYLEMVGVSDEIDEAYKQSIDAWIPIVAAVIEGADLILDVAADLAATAYVSLIVGVLLRWVLAGQQESVDDMCRAVEALLSGSVFGPN